MDNNLLTHVATCEESSGFSHLGMSVSDDFFFFFFFG